MDLEQAPAAVQSLARPVLGLLGIDPDTDSAFRIFYVFAILAGLIGICLLPCPLAAAARRRRPSSGSGNRKRTAGPLAMYGVPAMT